MLTLATQAPGEPEIFASLQGEGVSAGRACAFVRLSRCNLACVWCDTAYTWHFTGDNRPHRDGLSFNRHANQLALDEDDAAGRIAALGQPRLVVTGGEPLLQAPALARMLAALTQLRPDVAIEVETNGSVAPPPVLDPFVAQYNVSPKLSHSGNPADLALARLGEWAAHPRAWFKFVVAASEDLAEVVALVAAHAIAPARVMLMPEGRDTASIDARLGWLAPLCLEHGFGLSDRMHIRLYGDTRGT